MSRHRRQASQVLPPEIIAGDDPLRLSDFIQPGDPAAAHGFAVSANQRSVESRKAEANASTPAAANSQEASLKKPPVAVKDA
ncbi:ABC transporter domain-containing protein [Psidium guajava]|nr:ABC transporter domain-containing protein [Psidium guajava]